MSKIQLVSYKVSSIQSSDRDVGTVYELKLVRLIFWGLIKIPKTIFFIVPRYRKVERFEKHWDYLIKNKSFIDPSTVKNDKIN
jgi:hypothetical protein